MATVMNTQLFSDTQQPSVSRAGGERQMCRGKVPDKIQLLQCNALILGRAPGVGGVALQSGQLPGMISRRHASIRYLTDKSQWVLKDLKSTNGVHVNNVRIPTNEATPIQHGDVITFGLNSDQNELKYTAFIVANQPPVLNRLSTKTQTTKPCRQVKRVPKRSRSPQDKPVTPVEAATPSPVPTPSVPIPTPVPTPSVPLPMQSQPLPNLAVKSGSQSKQSNSQNCSKTTPPRLAPLSSEDIFEPPMKKSFTLDSLFDSKTELSEEMDEAIFGKTPSLTPRARAVLMGVKVSAVDIQVQMARDEVEREKSKIESKYKHLKSQLAVKDQLLKEKEKTEEKVSEAVEQEFICAICQELFIRSMTLSCSHSFCEWCLHQWMNQKGVRPVCPVCRTAIIQKPVRSVAVDNVIKRHVANLTSDQQVIRDEVVKQHYEALGLKPPVMNKPPVKNKPAGMGSAAMPIVVDSPVRAVHVTLSDSDSD